MTIRRAAASRALFVCAIVFGVLAALFVAAMVVVQSDWAEQKIEHLAAKRLGRELDLEDLQIRAAWPPEVGVGRLRIANPEWAHDEYLVDARGLRARVAVAPLLWGRIVANAVVDEATIGLEKWGDENTWTVGAEQGQSEQEQPADTGHFLLRSASIGKLRAAYRDEEDETEVLVTASGDLGREGRPFQVHAEGQFRGEALQAKAQAPAVPLSGDQPVQLSFEGQLGETRASGQTALRAGTDVLQTFEARLEVSGPSFDALDTVAGMDLPESAPYRVSAHIKHDVGRWDVQDFKLVLGKSDLQGSAFFEKRQQRPFLRGSFTSNVFDVRETGIKQEVKEKLEEPYLFPRGPWPTSGWDKLDAEIDLKFTKLRNVQPVPLDALEMRLVLQDSALRLDPVKIALASGTVSGRLALDASQSPEQGSAYIEIRGLRLSRLFPAVKKEKVALGRLSGRIELSGRGDSMAKLLGASNGRILFAAEGGTANAFVVEVLGLDAAEALMVLGKKRDLPLRCAVVDVAVTNGTAKISTFVIDTGDTVVSVEGSANLGKETLNMAARAEPRDTSPFTLRTPVNITGTFSDPKVRPQSGPLAGRAAAAVALAAINPLLALIPFADPGGDPEPGCQPQKPAKAPEKTNASK